jgi:hypothetical protein
MIQIKPYLPESPLCECGGILNFSGYVWQGLHTCKRFICNNCKEIVLESIPVNQSFLQQYRYYLNKGIVKDINNKIVSGNWYSEKLISIAAPVKDDVDFDVRIINKYDKVIILNTLDYVYGHSLLFFLNLQRILQQHNELGIILIVQPMLKWMIPESDIAEIWTVNLGFRNFNHYFPDLSDKINLQLDRFSLVYLSKGHIIPTNQNIEIERFTRIKPYNFISASVQPEITFIWREDPDRLWIRNYYLLKGCKKLGIGKILLPIHLLRVKLIFRLLKKRLGKKYSFSVAGLGKSGRLPSFVNDRRVQTFDDESEKKLCILYSQSILVFGIHGSSMLLPSAHSGMSVSLMPSKRWGNFAEDILFTEHDVRLSSFQRRIISLNISIFDLRDILCDMVTGRDYFLKKFIHSDEL